MTYPKEGIAHISALPPGVAMLVRIAACVAWFFAWPICAGFDGDTLSHLGIAVAIAQEIAQETVQEHVTPAPAPNVATEGELVETEAAPQQDAHKFTMRTEGAERRQINLFLRNPRLPPRRRSDSRPNAFPTEKFCANGGAFNPKFAKTTKSWRAAAKTRRRVHWRHDVSLPSSMRVARAAVVPVLA